MAMSSSRQTSRRLAVLRRRAIAALPRRSRTGPTSTLPRCRMTTSTPPAARGSRRWARPAGSMPSCRPRTAGCIRGSTSARSAWRARSSRFATASPTSPSPCRASAPARSRCSARAELQDALPAAGRDGQGIAAFALSEPEAGSDVAAMRPPRRPTAPSHRAHRRQEDLDLERRHRRPLRGVRAHRRRRRRQRAFGLRGRRRHARPAASPSAST